VCKLPLGVGSITLKAQSFPLQPGQVTIPVDIKLSPVLPASMAKTTTHVEAVSDTGDKLFCMDVNTKKAASLEEIAAKVNAAKLSWTAQAPSKFANVEEVKASLGTILKGEEGYKA